MMRWFMRSPRSPIRYLLDNTQRLGACLVWRGARTRDGYGVVRRGRRVEYVHRLVLELLEDATVTLGRVVMHACDNRACVRPSHLRVGTQTDNMRDAARKGRLRHGASHPSARLSLARVRAARMSAPREWAALARAWGVHQTTVARAAKGASWRRWR